MGNFPTLSEKASINPIAEDLSLTVNVLGIYQQEICEAFHLGLVNGSSH